MPEVSWTYVEVWKIGVIIAPVLGSGSMAAWITFVPNFI
jgi:hypothetical protein